jgi:hypothetical protein
MDDLTASSAAPAALAWSARARVVRPILLLQDHDLHVALHWE